MAEMDVHKQVRADRKNPRVASKVCEFMTYSGREAFKRLRTNVLIALGEEKTKGCHVLGVTSAQPSEGKSTVTINLAFSLAELGKSVLLLDGDMRRPSVHATMGCALSPGLSEVLNGSENLNKSLVRYKSSTSDASFDLIPGGQIPGNPSELLNSERFQKLIEVVSSAYDFVIVDLPPVNAVVDAVNAARRTEGMIVVIRENHCPRFVLADCMEQLEYAKANILGFVMNGCVAGAGKRYQYGRKYYAEPYSKEKKA